MNKKPSKSISGNQLSIPINFRDQRVLLLVCIVGLGIITFAVNPNFLSPMNIVSLFGQISVIGVMTMGMSKLLLSGSVDLSIGNIMALSGCVMAVLITGTTAGTAGGRADTDEMAYTVLQTDVGITSVPVAIIIGLLVATGCGWLNGFIIQKTKTMSLIITLGMNTVYFGIALLITDGRFMSFKMAFEPLRLTRIGDVVPVTLFFFFAVVVFTFILVNRTKFGRRIVAIGGNEMNARFSGINVDSYKIRTFVIMGLLCGIAAIIYASRLDAIKANSGDGYALEALIAAIIGGVTFDGGKGTISGTFLGVLFMGLIRNSMNMMQVSSNMQYVIMGIIIVVAVIISNLENIRKEFGMR